MKSNCRPPESSVSTDHQSETCSVERDHEMAESVAQSMRQVCACDASEQQARVILWHARRHMEEKYKCEMGEMESMRVHMFHHGHAISLKKSLSGFLQRRKDRIQASIQYKQKLIGQLNGSKVGEIRDE